MSVEQYVALPAGSNPSRADIEAAAVKLGLPIALTTHFELDKVHGFEPGTWDGRDAGVEMYILDSSDPDNEFEEFGEEFVAALSRYPKVVSFRWGGNALEAAFGCAVGATLVSLCGGIYYEAEGGTIDPVETVIAAAFACAGDA
jgi:hypothetical protein